MKNKYEKIHIFITLSLFSMSLFYPAYYINETHEPQMGYGLLLIGWLGPFDNHFSWFANPLLLIALFGFRHPKVSWFYSLLAVVLALSFLVHDEIIISEAPTYAPITAYGWGYLLWISSMNFFSVGQLINAVFSEEKKYKVAIAAHFFWLVIAIIVFSKHYYIGANSHYSIEVERSIVFNKECRESVEIKYKSPEHVSGIFYDTNSGSRFRKLITGDWHKDGGGVLGLGMLNSGLIKFYEIRNYNLEDKKKSSLYKYKRFFLGDYNGREVKKLSSEYAVITKFLNFPKKLNLEGAEITIKDLKDNTVVAKSKYVYDPINRNFCGHDYNGYFSASMFVIETLELSKSFPSIRDSNEENSKSSVLRTKQK
nr:hypothetical protein [uncultured Desulfuromonas sp.]